MLDLLLFVVSILILYFVVRMAVAHGVGDAYDNRKSREQAERLSQKLHDGSLRDTPES